MSGNDKPQPPPTGYPAPGGAAYYGQSSVPPVQAPYQQQQPYYYAPPPPQPPFRRRASPLLIFLIGLIVTFGVLALILWIVLRPDPLKAYVDSATLTRFNLTQGNRLSYDFKADVSIRNPNRKVGVYYDYLEADAYFDGEQFGFDRLQDFYQGHKSNAVVSPAFTGDSTFVDLGSGGVRAFEWQRGQGAFDIDLRLYGLVRYKVGAFRSKRYRMRVRCWLPGVRLAANTTAATKPSYPRTKCKVDY